MKIVLIVLLTVLGFTANASQLSCEQTVRISLADLMGEGKEISHIETVATIEAFSVIRVETTLKLTLDNLVSIPLRNTYKVLVENTEMGTCEVIATEVLSEVQ